MKYLKPLFDQFAKKSGPALILLAIIFLVPICYLIASSNKYLDKYQDFVISEHNFWGTIGGFSFLLLLFSVVIYFAMFITKEIPVIQRSDAEYARQLRNVFGGVAADSSGSLLPQGLSEHRAISITNFVLQAIGQRALDLGFDLVRSNIFSLEVTDSGKYLWCAELTPDVRFSYKMDWENNEKESTIHIPFGVGSSGTSFKRAHAVFSFLKENGEWQHMIAEGGGKQYLKKQFVKAHKDLKWILSMPIPSRVSPRYIVKGIMNVDCLGKQWDEKSDAQKLKSLAIDASVAAALIGLVNRSAGHLRGLENEERENASGGTKYKPAEDEVFNKIRLDTHDFDPRDCATPSPEFLALLAAKQGLGRLSNLTPEDLADYLKQQLSV